MHAAIDPWNGLWLGVLSHLWQTTLVLAVLAALAAAMRRAPAGLLNALWWIGLAKLLVPLELTAPFVRRALDPVAARVEASGIELSNVTVWLDRAAPVLNPASRAQAGAFGGAGAGGVIVALWAAGAVCFAWCVLRARGRSPLRTAVARGQMAPRMGARLDAALEGTRIPRSAIRVSRASVMPATAGVIRRRIVVPEVLIERLDERELRAVLLHEDAHRRRFEPLQVAIQRAAAFAFYFFPLLWPLLARLRDTSEMACDEAAVRDGVAPSDYARALARTLSIGLEPHGLAAALARGTPSLTRRRLERLTHEGRSVAMRKHWLCLAIAVLSVIAISATGMALLADRGQLAGGPGREVGKQEAKGIADATAKGIAKALAKGVARGLALDLPGAPAGEEATAPEERTAVEEAARAERETASAKAEALAEEAAAEKAAEAERVAAEEAEEPERVAAEEAEEAQWLAAEEAAAAEEDTEEEKTYTLKLVDHPDPEYPEDAEEDQAGGLVVLEITITPDGAVSDVVVIEDVEGYPSFAAAAESALWHWTFEIVGEPAEDLEVLVPIEFKMHGSTTKELWVTVPDAKEKGEVPEVPTPPGVPDASERPDVPAKPDAPEPDEGPAAEEVPQPEGPTGTAAP